jgi:hypothetical protein
VKKLIAVAAMVAAAAVGIIIWIFQPQQELLLSACIAKERCGYSAFVAAAYCRADARAL